MKKRLICMLLAVVMIFGCLSMTAFAASAFTVSVQDVEVLQNESEVSVPILVSCSQGVASFAVEVSYASDAFSFKSIKKGDVEGTVNCNAQKYPTLNPFKISYASADNLAPGEYVLATVVFSLKENVQPDTYKISISKPIGDFPSDEDQKRIRDYTVSDGSITVVDPRSEFEEISLGDGDKEPTVDETGVETYTYTYDGAAHTPVVDNKTLPDGTNVTYSYQEVGVENAEATTEAPKNAGTYEVTVTLEADDYKPMTKKATIVIDPKPITVEGLTADKNYDGNDVATIDTSKATLAEVDGNGGVVEGDVVSATFPNAKDGKFEKELAGSDVGTYSVTLTSADIRLDGADAANYSLKTPEVTATISKASVTVKADDKYKVQGADTIPDFTYKITEGQLFGEDKFTGSLTWDGNDTLGEHAIMQGTLAIDQNDRDNYTLTYVAGKLIISEAEVTEITVTGTCKKEYIHGDHFDPTGLTVTVSYNNGKKTDIDVKDCSFSPDPLTQGTTSVTVSYGGKSATVEGITVIPKLTGITVTGAKTEYVEGQKFNKNDMQVLAYYSNSETGVDVTDKAVVDTETPLVYGQTYVVVSYTHGKQSQSVNYAITVAAREISTVTYVEGSCRTDYIEGQTFDATGLKLEVTYNDGSDPDIVESGYTVLTSVLNLGDTTAKVQYRGFNVDVPVTVAAKKLTGISVDASKAKTTYVAGQTFSADKLVVTASYDNGTTATVTGYTVSTPDMTKTGKQTVTVTYQGKTATYEIEIVAKTLTGIALDLSDVTTSYYVDDEFSAKGLVVYAVYNDDTRVPVTDYQVSEPDMTTAGVKQVLVSYTEDSVTKTASYNIYVSEHSTVETYTITVIAGRNGTVYGSTTVVAGSDATFRFVPDDGYQVEDVLVNGKSVGAVTSYTFKDVHADATLTVTFVKSTYLPFVDVAKGAWYYDDVCFVYANGLMNGVSATRFAPTADFSRAMIAQVLYNLEGRPAVTASKTFSDVSASDWYADAVAWVTENGIFLGYGDGTFAPNTSISREQMATVLYRYVAFKGYNVNASANLARFTDAAKVSDWAKDGVIWAVDNGILGGYTDGSLRPLGTATRAEVAKMLTVFMENVIG